MSATGEIEPALRGQGDEYRRALDLARARRLPHAMILEGASGTGKSTAARVLASALLGARDASVNPRVASGNHPDLHLLEVPPDKLEIPVDQVRELLDRLQLRPVEGGARVAIVDPADHLNEQGQNALLKTLEEPGEDAFLLLVVERPESLLDTVRSRSGRLRLRPLQRGDLTALLRADASVSASEVERVIEGCGGSLGLARRLLDPEVRAVARAVETFLSDPRPDTVRPAAEALASSGGSGRTANDARARMVLRLLRGRLRAALPTALAAGDPAGYPSARSESCLAALDAVLDAEADLDLGIPMNQVIEGLLLRLCGVLGFGQSSV